jgi:hypothetical protein
LNDIGQTSTKDFVEYNWEKPREFIINSVIQSNLEDADPAQIPGQKINPMAIGLKLRISF